MKFLHTDIGSAKDNFKSPIHNWYKFTAGFSYKFVEEIINEEKLNKNSRIFDPFAGCGTTLVSSQKLGIPAVGNEGQEFMFRIIKAKLNWKLDNKIVENYLYEIESNIKTSLDTYSIHENVHNLLFSLYQEDTLKLLCIIRDFINRITNTEYELFFQLALSQTLHKVSIHPIAVPYISRNKTIICKEHPWKIFNNICKKMVNDLENYKSNNLTSIVHCHDSREINPNIYDSSINTCITSPPYLNNLDYGEVSKVHTYFYGITDNWNDVTEKVRKKLVTGSTTHYKESLFQIEDFKMNEFYLSNKLIVDKLFIEAEKIKVISKIKAGRKSFDILMLYYFQDMYMVLKEIKRSLKFKGTAYLILGDSAPYGVYVPTTEILGHISKNVGFKSFEIIKIRSRGTKWKTLRHRHSIELTENVLVLK